MPKILPTYLEEKIDTKYLDLYNRLNEEKVKLIEKIRTNQANISCKYKLDQESILEKIAKIKEEEKKLENSTYIEQQKNQLTIIEEELNYLTEQLEVYHLWTFSRYLISFLLFRSEINIRN